MIKSSVCQGGGGYLFPHLKKFGDISMIVTEVASSWLSVSRHLRNACSLGGLEL